MRRILFVAMRGYLNEADPSSIADRALLAALARRGFGVELVSEAPREPDAEDGPARDDAFLAGLDLTIERFKPDVLIAQGADPRAAEILRRGRARGSATVLQVADCAAVDPTSAHLVDAMLTTSGFAADYLREATDRPVTALPELVDLAATRAEPREARYLTFFEPTARGGLAAFARIADELGRRRPEIPILVIAGPEQCAALEVCGLDLKARGNIDLMSPPSDLRLAWERTRVALMPSLDWAAPPGLALGALINGLPVVASDRGSLPETLGPSGIVLPLPDRLTPATRMLPTPEEVAPWVAAILRLWDDDAFEAEHRRLARVEAGRWSPHALEPRYVEFFRDVTAGRGPIAPPPRRSGVVVLVPNLNGIEPECEDSLRQLERRGVRVVRRRGCSQIDVARNEMASDALHDGASSLLFIDADIGFEPADALRLLARPEPVISGLYAKKKHCELASTFAPGVGRIILGPKTPGPYPLQYAATGFLRVHAEVFRTMIATLGLPHCNLKWGKGVWPFFQPLVVPHPEGFHYLGEDWAFSHRLGQIGITPLADASFRLWHHGSYGYSWEDAGAPAPRYRDYQFQP